MNIIIIIHAGNKKLRYQSPAVNHVPQSPHKEFLRAIRASRSVFCMFMKDGSSLESVGKRLRVKFRELKIFVRAIFAILAECVRNCAIQRAVCAWKVEGISAQQIGKQWCTLQQEEKEQSAISRNSASQRRKNHACHVCSALQRRYALPLGSHIDHTRATLQQLNSQHSRLRCQASPVAT